VGWVGGRVAAIARLNAVAILCSVTGFSGLQAWAMHLYPGGTWWDRATVGHRFWENYVCDLEWEIALGGSPNYLGARIARAAILVLVAGFVPFWLALPSLFPGRRRTGRSVRALGLASVAGLFAVAWMPSDRAGALHGAAVITAAVPGMAATGLAVAGLLGGEPRPRIAGWTGATLLALAAADLALYVSHLVRHVEGTPLVVVLEKIAVLLLLGWMLEVGARILPRSLEGRVGGPPSFAR
jgi:hypothetical protein